MAERSPFQRFLGELRRRHVPQTMAVYAVAAWAAIQFADVVVPNLGWPQGVVTAVIIAAGVGLPVVLVLAWVFEWGPEGLHRTAVAPGDAEPARGGRPAPTASPPSYGPWLAAVTVLAVGIGVALTVGALMGDDDDPTAGTEAPEAMTRSERRRLGLEDSVPRPPRPPVMISPDFADSLGWLVSDSVMQGLGGIGGAAADGRLDSIVAMARRLGAAVAAGEGGAVEIRAPENWAFRAPVPLRQGDTLRVVGVVRDSAGVAEVLLQGRSVARPARPARELEFEGIVVAVQGLGIRAVPLVARMADGREIRRDFHIAVTPREEGG